ncbi:hypothetical protein GF382_03875 [Candidatus Falkowbacteria bacterium]|nr:hypothetical protein [Candidatus Falkowbacteria bacterium]
MKKTIKTISLLLALLIFLIIPYFVFATTPLDALKKTGDGGGFQEADETTLAEIAGTAVSAALGLLGVVFIGLIIYGGGLWMTAQGNDDQVKKAQNILRNSLIGLILVVSAYAVYSLISILFLNTLQ